MPTSKHDRKPGAAAGDQSEKQRQKHRKKSGQKSVQKSDPKSGRKNSQQKNQKRARDVALVAAWARSSTKKSATGSNDRKWTGTMSKS